MSADAFAKALLAQQARALLTRVERVKPFALSMPSVPAAALAPAAQGVIERHVQGGRSMLRDMVQEYLGWIRSAAGRQASPAEAQRRFAFMKLRFNGLLDDFDIFADVICQRAEHETGTWIAGLDAFAADALALPGMPPPPPVICYLDRGHGAAIRRARTRLPGGGSSPVAVVRVPRERMVGTGIASSLVHEVGHQATRLLGLPASLRPRLRDRAARGGATGPLWLVWARWLEEILADLWAVSRLGIGGTLGLMSVLSLPRPFVLRVSLDDPHPIPWLRVRLSCALGDALYPHPQWRGMDALWLSLYPPDDPPTARRRLLALLSGMIPEVIGVLTDHRPASLGGRPLGPALTAADRHPTRLRELFLAWNRRVSALREARPALVFAVLSQAFADGALSPEREAALISELLNAWALDAALRPAAERADMDRLGATKAFDHPTTRVSRGFGAVAMRAAY